MPRFVHAKVRKLVCLWLVVGAVAPSGAQTTITGLVRDATGRPVPDASVIVQGSGSRVLTDPAGAFVLRGVAPGPIAVITQAVGFVPDTTAVPANRSDSTSIAIRLTATVTLAEVRVAAPRTPANLVGFEERRRSGIGFFLDAEALRKLDNSQLGDVLARAPGVRVRRTGSAAFAESARAMPGIRATIRPPPCFMDVYLDGQLIYSRQPGVEPFNLNTFSVAEFAALEVYTSAARLPAQFNRTSSGCGLMLLWTRVR